MMNVVDTIYATIKIKYIRDGIYVLRSKAAVSTLPTNDGDDDDIYRNEYDS